MVRPWNDAFSRRWALLPLRLIVGIASGPTFGPPGYEINLLYIAALLALMLAGASALSVDGWLAYRKHRAR